MDFKKNFIEIFDNSLSKKDCEILISQYEKSKKDIATVLYGDKIIVDKKSKSGTQLNSSKFSDNTIISFIIKSSLLNLIEKYYEKYECLNYTSTLMIDDVYAFKKWDGKEDGFKVWHMEQCISAPNRVLVWNYYLNDAKCGTQFINYGTVRAKSGRCIIFPASFTHVHRSQIPNEGVKYIISGWISFYVKQSK